MCGAVGAAIDLAGSTSSVEAATGCGNLESLLGEIQCSVDLARPELNEGGAVKSVIGRPAGYANIVSRRNVLRTIGVLRERSGLLRRLEAEGKIALVGAFYEIQTGRVTFLDPSGADELADNRVGQIHAA
jgi:carbonic anhydrase